MLAAGTGSVPECWVALGGSLPSLGLTVHIWKGGMELSYASLTSSGCVMCTEGWDHVCLIRAPWAWVALGPEGASVNWH